MRCTLNTVEYAPSPGFYKVYLVWSRPKITLATFITIIAASSNKIIHMKIVFSWAIVKKKDFERVFNLFYE